MLSFFPSTKKKKKQIAARGYASGAFDLPPKSQRLCFAGRPINDGADDDAATLGGLLGLSGAGFVEQVAGFVVLDKSEKEEEEKEQVVAEKEERKKKREA